MPGCSFNDTNTIDNYIDHLTKGAVYSATFCYTPEIEEGIMMTVCPELYDPKWYAISKIEIY